MLLDFVCVVTYDFGVAFRLGAGNTFPGWPRWDLVNPAGAFFISPAAGW